MPTSPIAALFASYEDWYRTKYVPKLVVDDPEGGMRELVENRWDRPLRSVRPLLPTQVAALELTVGVVPRPYAALVTEVGVGTLLAAGEDEPAPFRLLRPTELRKATKTARETLEKEDLAAAARLGLDVSKMLAFMTDGENLDEASYFFLLTRQTKTDDRVVLVDPDHEPGWPFGRKKPVAKPFMAFVERWVAMAKKRNPLNPFDGL